MSAQPCGCDPDAKLSDGCIGWTCQRHIGASIAGREVEPEPRQHKFDCPCTQLTAGEDGKVYSWPDECCTCEPPT